MRSVFIRKELILISEDHQLFFLAKELRPFAFQRSKKVSDLQISEPCLTEPVISLLVALLVIWARRGHDLAMRVRRWGFGKYTGLRRIPGVDTQLD